MGMVFLAEHPVIGAKVALKAIHPQFARRTDVVSRFVNEAKVVNQIRHDHIVDITDFGTTGGGDFYFLMEYLEGETLSQSIARQGAFPVARALNVAAQIADALQASHEHGVIHRDLKPDNVILVTRGETLDFVKVLDFGLAKLTHEGDGSTTDAGSGLVMGSPAYMSPEQCDGRSEIDRRSDIYALGIIFFEMVTGRAPFSGSSYKDVLVQQLTARPPAPRSFTSQVPAAIDAIIDRALAKDPAARFQTMAELGAALRDPGAFAPEPPAVRASASREDDDDLRPKRNRRPLVAVVAVAAACAAFIAKPQLWAQYAFLRSAVVAATHAASIAADPGLDSDPPLPSARASARVPVFAQGQRHRHSPIEDETIGDVAPEGVLAPSEP